MFIVEIEKLMCRLYTFSFYLHKIYFSFFPFLLLFYFVFFSFFHKPFLPVYADKIFDQ